MKSFSAAQIRSFLSPSAMKTGKQEAPAPHHEEDLKDEGNAPVTPAASTPSRRHLVRRIDILLLPLLTICYGLQFYDKAVLGSATIFGILEDLSLVTVSLESGGTRDLSRYSAATAAFVSPRC